MACIVSLGEAPEENWMVENAIYSWFVRLATMHCSDEEICSRLAMSELTNGLSLDDISKENSVLARRLTVLLRSIAVDIAGGKHPLTDVEGLPLPEMQKGIEDAFARLVKMLDAWCVGNSV